MAGKPGFNCSNRAVSVLFLLLCIVAVECRNGNSLEGPRFYKEPDGLIEFSNSTGFRVECIANGSPPPRITWTFASGSAVTNIPGLRQMESDGTLVFYPFRAEEYRQDVHAVVYRCLAFNSVGSIISRTVQVKAVVVQSYDVYVYDTYVIRGNTAVFKCHVPGFLGEYVKVISWIKDETSVIEKTDMKSADKFIIAPNGNLYIRNTQSEDGRSTYQCKTSHRLTNVVRVSGTHGKLFITDPEANVSPRISDSIKEITATVGEKVIIPCVAQAYPQPQIVWFIKVASGHLKPLEVSNRIHRFEDGLQISVISKAEAGVYVCKASNVVGTEQLETNIAVKVPVEVSIVPARAVIERGRPFSLTCEFMDQAGISLTWLKDGKPLKQENVIVKEHSLTIYSASQFDKGMYQCFLESDGISVHATSEIVFEDSAPELTTVFEEKILHPGSAFSLLCQATGVPPPIITWTVDNVKYPGFLEDQHSNGFVISWLNITNVDKEDGGVYGCTAENKAGIAKHFSKINVIGSLAAKSEQKITAVAGTTVQLICPVIGYPISHISWEKDGITVPANLRQTLTEEGFLYIENVHKTPDSGQYVCQATDNKNSVIEAAVQLIISVPPKIMPFGFQEDLIREGMRARIQCIISEGDLPLTIKWTKDGFTIPRDLGVTIRDLDEFSSILTISIITPKHNGNYTCTASNAAASVSHSATLSVNVAPKIIPFSFQDDQFFKGMRVHIICAVSKGDLPINFYWLKDGQKIPESLEVVTRNIDVHANSLSIESVSSLHTGNYTCIASNEAATVDYTTQLLVYVAPKISPFSFQDDNTYLGAFARVSCLVYQGDFPIRLSWLKDGQPITDSEINVRTVDDYSSILSINNVQIRHTGNYTCVARNAAATISYTTELIVNVPPKIVPFTFQDDNLIEGMLIRVSCVVSRGDLPLTIEWTKNGRPIASDLSIKIRDFDDYSSVLSIDPVTSHHNGNYTCIASNHAGIDKYTSSLLVNVPPSWTVEPFDSVITKGQSVMLNCQAKGFPQPTIRWMKALANSLTSKRIPIKSSTDLQLLNNGSIFLPKANLNHQGYYFCYASNGVGLDISKSIQLTIQAPVYFKVKSTNYKIQLGQSAVIACEAFGDPPVSFTWSKNESNSEYKLHQQGFIEEIKNDTEKGTVTSEIHLKIVRSSDAGVYACKAENSYGSDKMTIEVIVQTPPSSPEIQTIANIGNKSAEITWNHSFDGNSPVIHYILQHKRKQDSWQSRTITLTVDPSVQSTVVRGLQAATVYEFRLAAENAVGKSQYSPIVSIETGEEAPDGSPQEVEVEAIDTQTIRVSWKPPSKHQWNGIIRGYYIGYKLHGSYDPFTFANFEVPEDYGDDLIYQLTNLKMFTQYSIIVQAYNNGGRGPSSEEVVTMTSEDVPSQPPQNVRCSSLSSRSVYVIWEPPVSESTNGIIRGYKVHYKPIAEWIAGDVKLQVTEASRLTLQGLQVDANYSIQILAFTKMGDGVKSEPVFCKTYEDVPEAPEAIKVLPSSMDSVLVAWKSPKKPNGVIMKYNVYYKPLAEGEEYTKDFGNKNGKSNVNMNSLSSDFSHFEVKGLKANGRYALWVTATSSIGEGPESQVVIQSTAGKMVPAKSASFDDKIKTSWKRDVVLPCRAVGIPQPQKTWISRGQTVVENDRILIRYDGSLIIKRIDSEDSGNYTCKINNQFGKDEVHYSLNVIVPPGSPILDILSKSVNSVRLRWQVGSDGGDPIKGFVLHYKRDAGQWEKKELSNDAESYTVNSLSCGTTYQFYIEAFNSIGTGAPCDIVTVSTNGESVSTPSKDSLIKEGSTFATINLDTWTSSGCPISFFVVEYKQHSDKGWTLVSDHVKPEQRKLIIPGLLPASWYVLRITAHTSADDFNIAEYIFSTLTISGGSIPHEDVVRKEEKVIMYYLDPYIFIPVVIIIIIIIIASLAVFIYCRRNNDNTSQDAPIDWTRSGTLARYRNEMGASVESFIHLQKMGANTLARNATMKRRRNDVDPTYATIKSMNYQTLSRRKRAEPIGDSQQGPQVVNATTTGWITAGTTPSGHLIQVPVAMVSQPNNSLVPTKTIQYPESEIYGGEQSLPNEKGAAVASQNNPDLSKSDVHETSFTADVTPKSSKMESEANCDKLENCSTLNRKTVETGDEDAWLLEKP